MATTNVTLTNGNYTYVDGTIKSSGGLNIFGDTKTLQRIDGNVFDGDTLLGNFSAYRDMGEGQMRYNTSFTDPSVAGELSQIAYAVVLAVEAAL